MIPPRPRSKSTGGMEEKSSEHHLLDCVPKSISTPTLADLFTPPPAQMRRSLSGSSATNGSSALSKSKGKKRMPGERPMEDTSSGNHSIIQLREPSNSTETIKRYDEKLFRCDSCRVAGGTRKCQAPFCPGRTDGCIVEDSSGSFEQFGVSIL